jgi:hypothetical protein
MSSHRSLVIGLPESGKTTFIAALWHVLESEEVPSALRVRELAGDRAYLNKLRNAWLRCEPVGKTEQDGATMVRMLLEDRTTHVTAELWLPDIAGETYRDHWVHRQWSAAFDELAVAADGALLFVHPSEIAEPLRIDAVNALAEAVRGDQEPTVTNAAAPTKWDPQQSPTQVQLVDLLQFLAWRRGGVPLSLGLIVSAWDLVRDQRLSPSKWCASRLPLLGQFLASNEDRFRVAYYGVSAQGGVIPRDADRLREFTHASQRIEVVADDLTSSHDITVPVQRLSTGSRP